MGKKKRDPDEILQTEDIALKAGMEFFGEEILPLLGETEKILHAAPTERIRLEARRMYEDFTFVMQNGKWYHFEFESDRITRKDLFRFREYEAAAGRTFGVEVVTYIICTAKVKHPLSELKVGMNTYRVKIIRTRMKNVDRLFGSLQKKAPGTLAKKELLPVCFSPLLGGKMEQKERIIRGFDFLREYNIHVNREELEKMQAILYLLAGKFLTEKEMKEVKEEIAMTVLGKMLVEDGIRKGIAQGVTQGITQGRAAGIIELLDELGDVPDGLKDIIYEQKDNSVLKDWHRLAAHAGSVEEFEGKSGILTAVK